MKKTFLFLIIFTFLSFIKIDHVYALNCQVGQAPYTNIQSAINDTNCTHVGIPIGTYNETLSINRSVTLIGENRQQTILTGSNAHRIIQIASQTPPQSIITIKNLTITDGYSDSMGAGVSCRPSFLNPGDTLLLNLERVNVINNRGEYGTGGLHAVSCNIDIKNSLFENNASAQSNGAIDVANAEYTNIAKSRFINNQSGMGSSVELSRTDNITIRRSHFIDNNTNEFLGASGALSVESFENAEIQNSNFINNGSNLSQGGALSVRALENSQISINRSVFENNHSAIGAAIYTWPSSQPVFPVFNINNSRFTRNHSEDSGGALYVFTNQLEISNSIFEANRGFGASIWTESYPQRTQNINISNTRFLGNISTGSYTFSGTIFIGVKSSGSQVNLSQVEMDANQTEQCGTLCMNISTGGLLDLTVEDSHITNNQGGLSGFFFMSNILGTPTDERVTIRNSEFINNRGHDSGVFAVHEKINLNIEDSIFLQNHSDTYGSVIHSWQSNSVFNLNRVTLSDNTQADDGAIFILDNDLSRLHTFNAVEANHNVSLVSGVGLFSFSNLSANITNSNIINNQGFMAGGIDATNANVNIIQTKLDDNQASQGSGAVNAYNANITLDKVSINNHTSQNSASISLNGGNHLVKKSSITNNSSSSQNSSGGIHVTNGILNLQNSTLSNNQGPQGGALLLTASSATIDHATIFNNTSSQGGAGILSNNSNALVRNSVIANNTGGSCLGNITQEPDFSSVNDDMTCTNFAWNDMPLNLINLLPLALMPNGTMAHIPVPTSILIDNAQELLIEDQLESLRPQDFRCDQDINPDIGAIEVPSNCPAAP
ncbi:hypothetical protein K1X76_06390 [bacterium]|nr:hypothetical protein [bacterium]